MPIPGLCTTYDLVDWLKERKYHVATGDYITISGETGGLITVDVVPVRKPNATSTSTQH